MSTRPYDNTLRTEQARLTRRRIVDAARTLLLDGGSPALSINALAATAGVSVQTIYNAVGNKAAVVKAVYDVTLAGDDEPRPMQERPDFLAVVDAMDAASALRAYATFSRRIVERVGPLLMVVLTSTDDDLRSLADVLDEERRHGNSQVVSRVARRFGLPAGITRQRAVDIVWALTAPELYDRLVRRRCWSHDDYEQWLASSLIATLTAA